MYWVPTLARREQLGLVGARTDHPAGPECAIVQEDPSLLSKPNSCFLLCNPCPCSYWREDVVHDGAAHAREHDDPVEDEEDVIPAKGKCTSRFVVVGDAKELSRVVAYSRKGHMGEKED